MSIYYRLSVKKNNVNLDEVKSIAEMVGYRFIVDKFGDEFIVHILDICSNRFHELKQLFPFEKTKDPSYAEDKDYAFSNEEKEKLLNFFEDVKLLFYVDDCLSNYELYSHDPEAAIGFPKFDMEDWNRFMSEHEKNDILARFKKANLDIFQIMKFL